MTLRRHGLGALAVRRAKVAILQGRRLVEWGLAPAAWRPSPCGPEADFAYETYRRVIPIRRDGEGAHPRLEEGKRVNLALAAPLFDGRVIGPEAPLSFWRTLGRVSEGRGFRHGVELRGGCIVPTIGGGLCLLSNALFQMATTLDWHILERHGHTMDVAASNGVWGLDATVFWPHVDLRIAPRRGRVRLEVSVIGDELILAARGTVAGAAAVEVVAEADRVDVAGNERYRSNRVRRVVSGEGRVVRDEIVAINRKKLLTPAARQRNCLTCDERECRARPRSLP